MEDLIPVPQRQRSPWVLVGTATTAGILLVGLLSFKNGHTRLSQHMMRARVIAQGATVGLMAGTSGYFAATSEGGDQ